MVAKLIIFTLISIVPSFLGVLSLQSTPKETMILVELTERLNSLQNRVETLETENGMLTTRFDDQKMENAQLKSDVKELKVQVAKQDEEILFLRSHVSNLESFLAPKWASSEKTKPSSNKNDGSSVRSLSGPPSSCQELKDKSNNFMPIDGIHLLRNKNTKKMEAAFCTFPSSYSAQNQTVSQDLIGHVDVKTSNVHFYVQRNSTFYTADAVIPFQLARLNEGGAFDLASGIFTVPVPGIYHFDFSVVKSPIVTYLWIYLQVNGVNVGAGDSNHNIKTESFDTVSLSASLRLAAGDRVNLYNDGGGVLYDNGNHQTHFTGWLMEEDLL